MSLLSPDLDLKDHRGADVVSILDGSQELADVLSQWLWCSHQLLCGVGASCHKFSLQKLDLGADKSDEAAAGLKLLG